MKTILHTIISITSLIIFAGCSAFQPGFQTITVNTSEPQAKIWINNIPAGETPIQKAVKRNQAVNILAQKKGFQPVSRTIDKHISTTGALDIAGTLFFLVPGIGRLTPGAGDLDETDIFIQLYPQTATAPSSQTE